MKLAAMELALESESGAPLVIGGILIDGERRFATEIPRLGSLVATNSLDGVIPGLLEVPADERPPANVVHLAFQAMVGLGSALAVLGVIALRAGRRSSYPRWLLKALVAAGPAAVVALEAGWITTEVGRQPWIVHEVMRVEEAVTDTSWIPVSLALVALIYTVLTVVAVKVLRSMARRWREGDDPDLPTPYGALVERQ